MLRIGVASVFLVIAVVAIVEAVQIGATTPSGTVLLNVGTEVIGIVLTVAVVEWIFERRRLRQEVEKLAWRALHELDHTVWVWQGGRRDFDVDELLALIQSIGDEDPVEPFTGNLLLLLGSRAQTSLRLESGTVNSDAELKQGLEALQTLSGMRDHEQLPTAGEIRVALHSAVQHLVRAVGLRESYVPSLQFVDLHRNPDPERQVWRHYGD